MSVPATRLPEPAPSRHRRFAPKVLVAEYADPTAVPTRVASTRDARSRARRSEGAGRGAQRAVAWLFLANTALGALVLGTALLVLAQLLETWRLGGANARDVVVVLGQRIAYPAANAGAIVVAVLAGLGLVIVTVAARAASRELRADRRLRHAMARRATVRVEGAWVVEDDRAQAFCAGLFHPRVYVSRAALELLTAAELSAVLAHERHHARQRDPLRLAATRVLADAAFFLAPLLRLIERQHSLAEIAADEAAVAARGGDRAALAGAMLRFSESGGEEAGGIAPERIDHLVGEGHPWRFPTAVVLAIGVCFAAVGALGVLAAEAASGTATLALPFISSQPCILVLASIPGATISAGVLSVRRGAPRSRLARAAAYRD